MLSCRRCVLEVLNRTRYAPSCAWFVRKWRNKSFHIGESTVWQLATGYCLLWNQLNNAYRSQKYTTWRQCADVINSYNGDSIVWNTPNHAFVTCPRDEAKNLDLSLLATQLEPSKRLLIIYLIAFEWTKIQLMAHHHCISYYCYKPNDAHFDHTRSLWVNWDQANLWIRPSKAKSYTNAFALTRGLQWPINNFRILFGPEIPIRMKKTH